MIQTISHPIWESRNGKSFLSVCYKDKNRINQVHLRIDIYMYRHAHTK